MKLQIVLMGLLFCLSAPAQGQKSTEQSANRVKRPAITATQSVTGCVDQEKGRYVIRDEKTSQLLNLQAPGPDADSYFARFLGHKTQVTGTADSAGAIQVAKISQVADMCGSGK